MHCIYALWLILVTTATTIDGKTRTRRLCYFQACCANFSPVYAEKSSLCTVLTKLITWMKKHLVSWRSGQTCCLNGVSCYFETNFASTTTPVVYQLQASVLFSIENANSLPIFCHFTYCLVSYGLGFNIYLIYPKATCSYL